MDIKTTEAVPTQALVEHLQRIFPAWTIGTCNDYGGEADGAAVLLGNYMISVYFDDGTFGENGWSTEEFNIATLEPDVHPCANLGEAIRKFEELVMVHRRAKAAREGLPRPRGVIVSYHCTKCEAGSGARAQHEAVVTRIEGAHLLGHIDGAVLFGHTINDDGTLSLEHQIPIAQLITTVESPVVCPGLPVPPPELQQASELIRKALDHMTDYGGIGQGTEYMKGLMEAKKLVDAYAGNTKAIAAAPAAGGAE